MATYSDLQAPDNLTPSRNVKVLVSGVFAYGDPAPTRTVALAAGVDEGDDQITVASEGFGRILFEGTKIEIGTTGSYVIVRKKTTTTTQTVIDIERAKFTAALATPTPQTCTIRAWIPVISAKTYNIDASNNEGSDSVFSDDLAMEKFIESVNYTGSISGPEVYGDPALKVITTAEEEGACLYLEILKPGQRGGRDAQCYVSRGENGEKASYLQNTINLTITGKAGYIDGMATSPFDSDVVAADYTLV
jgi:hypothetical protein